MQIKQVIIVSTVFLFLLIFASSAVHAAGYGYSKVSLTQYSVNISQGSYADIGFTISLFNGSYWATSLAESPLSSYITFTPSTSLKGLILKGLLLQLKIYCLHNQSNL